MTAHTTMTFDVTFADEYAALKARIDADTKKLDAMKKAIIAAGKDKIVGLTCDLEYNLFEQSRVDTDAMKAHLTPEQIEACKKSVDINKITVKTKGV
jgi:hypothetical protein